MKLSIIIKAFICLLIAIYSFNATAKTNVCQWATVFNNPDAVIEHLVTWSSTEEGTYPFVELQDVLDGTRHGPWSTGTGIGPSGNRSAGWDQAHPPVQNTSWLVGISAFLEWQYHNGYPLLFPASGTGQICQFSVPEETWPDPDPDP